MRRLLNFIIDVIFPRFCFGCGHMGEFLCDRCYSRLNFIITADLRAQLFPDLKQCFLERIQALLVYDELLQKMIHHYKYLGCRDLYQNFAYWLWQFSDFGQVDVITYIPVHRKRLRERGYNQAELIARELARLSGVPCVSLLTRPIYRTNQARSKNKSERLRKTQDIFALAANHVPSTARILLVDDVITSGATINEAARVLTQNHFQHVQALALAHGD